MLQVKLAHLSILFMLLVSTSSTAVEFDDAAIAGGAAPVVGDSVVLRDFARCTPGDSILRESAKGKWWLRPYRAESGSEAVMLCVEERDMDDPQSCIAPPLTYPLALEGVYDIWVGTYRVPEYGGGIDIKLTRDKTYTYIDPAEDNVPSWPPDAEQTSRLVECFYKTADMSGQSIRLRQPHGSYDSWWWGLCEAHIAYIKLVRRDPEDLERERQARETLERKGVIVDMDGFSYVWQYGVEDIDCLIQQVEPYQYGNADAINWCIGGSLATNFPHPMTTGRINTTSRLGDKRATRVFAWFEENGIDTLKVLVDRCHELGLKIYAAHRANVHYYPSDVWDEHPDWHLESRRGLNYANPEARGFYRDFLLYIPEHYDVDGLTVDFSRHRQHFNPGQPDQFEHMNTYLRELRAGLDRIGQQKGKPLDLNVSFTCGTWYDNQTPADQGLDVETWVKEGIVTRIMPEGRDSMKYIEMCKDSPVQCYQRKTRALDFDANTLQAGLHDPTPAEDKKDRPQHPNMGPLEVAKGALERYDAGADGIFLFNYPPMVTLQHLPYPAMLRQEVKSGQPFGRVLGEKVEWLAPAPEETQ